MPPPTDSPAPRGIRPVGTSSPLWLWPRSLVLLLTDMCLMYTETDRSQKMTTETVKSSRGESTRRRIVEQSAAVFNQHGYSGTSMSELMTATGLEKGGI